MTLFFPILRLPRRPLGILTLGLLGVAALTCPAAEPIDDKAANPWTEDDWQKATNDFLARPFEPVGGYLFGGDEFPRIRWSDPLLAARVWDAKLPPLRVRWFDPAGEVVEQPSRSGRHIAVVEAHHSDGRRLRRGLCLFRIEPQAVYGIEPFPFQPTEEPGFGLDPEQWLRQRDWMSEFVRQAAMDHLVHHPDGAIHVAAVVESDESSLPSSDTFPHQLHRLRVLPIRRQLSGERLTPTVPLERPRSIEELAATLGMREQENTAFQSGTADALDDFCRQWQTETKLPFTLVVARHGRVLFHRAYGARNDEPASRETSYPLFSLSKSVTGVLALMMHDSGTIDLDVPIDRFLEGLDRTEPGSPRITTRRCLMHVTGLSGHGEWGGLDNPWLDEVVGDALAIGHVSPSYHYSGTAYDLAGLAMEHRTGKLAGQLFRKHLFKPLGIRRARVDNLGSGIHLRAIDLARIGQLLLNRGRYGRSEFFSEAAFEEILPRSYADLFPGIEAGERDDYGLGIYWRTDDHPTDTDHAPLLGRRTLGHGSFSGCVFRVDLETDLVIAMGRFQSGPGHRRNVSRLVHLIADHLE